MLADTRAKEASVELLSLIAGAWITQAIYVAAKLGIADQLREGPKSAVELGTTTNVDASALHRVLRALASVDVFKEDDAGRFSLTSSAEYLVTDAAGSLRHYAIMIGERWVWRSCGEMLHSVRTGRPGFDHVFGEPLFDYYAGHPEAARVAAAALTNRSTLENEAVVAAYSFSDFATIVDVGGGQGSLLASVLSTSPGLRGLLFDLPHQAEGATALLRQAGVLERCRFVPGSFFESIPSGGDIYILKKVIHDWGDERARAILRNCRAAIPPQGRLLMIESVIPAGNKPFFGKLLDLLMLAYVGGRERTADEYNDLLASAGFRPVRICDTTSPVSIIEARPI
jgi:hypothetical protein